MLLIHIKTDLSTDYKSRQLQPFQVTNPCLARQKDRGRRERKERERERDRQTDRQTDRESERETERETKRERNKEREQDRGRERQETDADLLLSQHISELLHAKLQRDDSTLPGRLYLRLHGCLLAVVNLFWGVLLVLSAVLLLQSAITMAQDNNKNNSDDDDDVDTTITTAAANIYVTHRDQ